MTFLRNLLPLCALFAVDATAATQIANLCDLGTGKCKIIEAAAIIFDSGVWQANKYFNASGQLVLANLCKKEDNPDLVGKIGIQRRNSYIAICIYDKREAREAGKLIAVSL